MGYGEWYRCAAERLGRFASIELDGERVISVRDARMVLARSLHVRADLQTKVIEELVQAGYLERRHKRELLVKKW